MAEEMQFLLEPITKVGSLNGGDHLAVLSETAEYYHHGIYLGTKCQVAEFTGESKCHAKVVANDILEFIGSKKLFRVCYKEGSCLPVTETINMAKTFVNNPSEWKRYHLLVNNCEHFATHCKTGKGTSAQAIAALKKCIEDPFNIEKATGIAISGTSALLNGGISMYSPVAGMLTSTGSLIAGTSVILDPLHVAPVAFAETVVAVAPASISPVHPLCQSIIIGSKIKDTLQKSRNQSMQPN